MSDGKTNKSQSVLTFVVIGLVLVVAVESYLLFSRGKPSAEAELPGKESLEADQQPKGKQPSAIRRGLESAPRDFFAEMRMLQRKIDRMFEESFMRGFHEPFYPMDEALPWYDLEIDLVETDNGFRISCDLPGLEKEALKIFLQGNILTIEGEREESKQTEDKDKGFISRERHFGSFSRSVSLPAPVDPESVKAEYKNGVLLIDVKKLQPEKPKKTKIDVI